MASWEDYLKTIYYDPSHPASFSGPQKLYKVVQKEGKYDIGLYRIRKFLNNQESYSLHKPVRRFQRNHIVTAGKNDLWMADLIDMVKFEKMNDGFKYILLVIDSFSKYVWLRPLQNKTGNAVATAFQDIFKDGQTPAKLITDKGQEFRAKTVQSLMAKNNVRYFPTQNETKASISERAIKTFKTKLYRYFTYKDDYTYLPVLQEMASSLNNTYHRIIGREPSSVNQNNSEEVRLSTYFARKDAVESKSIKKRFKFKVGDHVRISHLTTKFSRAYDETYTGELFKIANRYYRGTLPVYRLNDLQNEEIKGTFYQSELQKVNVDPGQTWTVEKILKTRGKGQNKQYFVKWKYYPKKFNSWISSRDIN